jgi:type IV pilus biogenesis protein CpaD/CtpE
MIMTRAPKTFALLAAFAIAALSACASEEERPVAASANACPAWFDYPQDRHSNLDSPYLGCANMLNLRHMAEDPNDLKHGRDLGPADGARQAAAVKNYEEDKVKTSAAGSSSQAKFTPVMTGGSGSGGQ